MIVNDLSSAFGLLREVGIFIAVPVLVVIAWNLWLSYINTLFLNSIKWVLLEIKPPQEVLKSPAAMELVLNALYQTGGVGNWYDRYWKGNLRDWFSLEIISEEGNVRFLIRTNARYRKLIESQIYAQYPQAQVIEVEDYTKKIPPYAKKASYGLWGCRFVLEKEDAYPIKTYVDYGLDKAVGSLEEGERIDPITPLIEFMGSLGTGERLWFQILVRADTKRFTIVDKKTGKEQKRKGWKDRAKALADELRAGLRPPKVEGEPVSIPVNTRGQLGVIEAIERSINKQGFDCGMRVIYLANKEHFDITSHARSVTGMLRQFNTGDMNAFKVTDTTHFDFPWQDPFGGRLLKKKQLILEKYKSRSYFYGSFDSPSSRPGELRDFLKGLFTSPNHSGEKPFILTSEELATIFHLPGRVAETPTFGRVESTTAEPPANLPI